MVSSGNPPCLEAFKAVQGISWVPPAAVLPASNWPSCQTLAPCPSQCLLVCGFAKGMLLPGSFRKCLMGDDPPCHAGGREVAGWAFEESWGEISVFYFLYLFGFVSFVLAQRSFALLGQFFWGRGSSLTFVDCKTIWEQRLGSQRSSPVPVREGQTVLVPKYFSRRASQICHHQRGTFPFCRWSCLVYSCWGVKAWICQQLHQFLHQDNLNNQKQK